MMPAEITFPVEVRRMALVNRTIIENKNANIIEGVLTGEMPGEDRAGVQEMMNAFQSTISNTPRFEVIRATEELEGNSFGRAFPTPLEWEKVEELCNKYNCDVLVSVEMFDTDFVTDRSIRKVKQIVEIAGGKREVFANEFYVTGVGNVTAGFRIYDPVTKNLVDEQLFTETHRWQTSGGNPAVSLSGIISRMDAIRYVSGLAGSGYAHKIAPLPIRIRREFYSKSRRTPQIATGTRLGDVNEWEEAIEVWKMGLDTRKLKDAGKLCYNIAIGYEVLGELDLAIEWAKKSYVNYGNKLAQNYTYRLERRKNEEMIIDEQLK